MRIRTILPDPNFHQPGSGPGRDMLYGTGIYDTYVKQTVLFQESEQKIFT